MGNNDTKGLYIGKSHAEGGIPAVNVDTGQLLEIEGEEYKICNSAYNSSEVLTYTNKTNKEILDDIHDNFACKFDKNEVSNGDFIICKVVVQDPKKHTRKGNVRDILDQMQSEKSCNVSVGSRVLKDGGLIAPNGKPSNLTPQQYKLVRTKAFKDWFGDWENDPENASKVVDENGEPLVVYHGTKSFDIHEFDLSKSKRISSGLKEFGTYFTDNINLAKAYRNWSELKDDEEFDINFKIYKWEKIRDESRNNRDYYNAEEQIKLLKESKKGKVYAVFLNLKNIYVFDAKGEVNIEAWNNLEVKASYKWATNRDAMEFLKEGKFDVEKVDGIKAENIVDAFVQTEQLKKELLSNVYLVFDSKNIKLADGTNTTFDGDNPDIRFEKGGSTTSLSDEQKDILKEWRELVNMTEKELEDFIKTKEGREAGMSVSDAKELGISSGRTSAKWILRMKETSPTNWTPTMWKWAKKQINFIKRMSGNKGDLFDENGNKTRKHTSLLLWGHNPKKMALGGNISETEKRQKRALLQEVQYTTQELKDMANGTPIDSKLHKLNSSNKDVYYHVTGKEIDTLKPCFHVGTKKATEKRAEHLGYGDNAIMYKVEFVRPPKYKVVSDRMANLYASCRKGIIINDDASIDEIKEIGNIVKNGFTALKYKNEIEGGDSYLIIDPKIVKIERVMETIFNPKNNKTAMEEGGEIYKEIEFPTYILELSTDNNNYEYNYGYFHDKDKALSEFNFSDFTDFTDELPYEGVIILFEKIDTYKFVGDLDEDEDISNYPIEDYYDDDDYYELISSSDLTEIESKEIVGEKQRNEDKEEEYKEFFYDYVSGFKQYFKEYIHHSESAGFLGKSSYFILLLDSHGNLVSNKNGSLYDVKQEYITYDVFNERAMETNEQTRIKRTPELKDKSLAVIQIRISDHPHKYSCSNCDAFLSIVIDKDYNQTEVNDSRLFNDDYNVEFFMAFDDESSFSYLAPSEIKEWIENMDFNELKDKQEFANGGQITSPKIYCRNCDWSWNVKDGGHDLYVCHKCGNDNEKYYNKMEQGGEIDFSKDILWQIFQQIATSIDKVGDNSYKVVLEKDVTVNEAKRLLSKFDSLLDLGNVVKIQSPFEITDFKNRNGKVELTILSNIKVNKMEQGGEVTNQEIMGTQLNLLNNNEDILGENLFNQVPTRKKFAYGGVISDVQKWDDVPNEWKNLKDTKPVKVEPSPTDKGLQKIFKPFIGDDALRPVMSGVYFDEDGIVATDAHKLLVIPYDGDKRGIFAITNSKSADKKIGEEIDGKYPTYKVVIPKNPIQHKITVNKLVQFLQAAMNYTNTITRQVRIVVDKDNSFGVNAKNMIIALNSMLELGYKEVYVSYDSPSKAIVITPNKDYDPYNLTEPLALVMPVMILKDDINDKVSAVDIGYNKSLFVNFDLSKNEIINGDGSVAQFKMDYGKGVLFNEDDISLINKFIPRKSSLPILENLVVKDGYLMATDLESSVKIKQSKAKDGIYSILNKVPYIDTNQELDDFPKFPSFDGAEKLFSIDKEFLKFIIDRAMDYVSNDELRATMSGVNIKKEGSEIVLAATDAYILLRYELTKYCSDIVSKDFNFTIKPKPLKDMLLYSKSNSISFFTNETNAFIKDGDKIEVSTRLVDYNYPNYESIIPSSYSKTLSIDVSDLKNILNSKELKDIATKYKDKTISVMGVNAGENLDVYVVVSERAKLIEREKIGSTPLNYKEDGGRIEENCILIMPVGLDDFSYIFAFNPKFLSTILKFGKTKEVNFYFSEKNRAYIIQGDFMEYEGGNKKYVIESKGFNYIKNSIRKRKSEIKELKKSIQEKEASSQPPQDNQNLAKVIRGLKLLEQTDEMKKVIRGLEYIMKMGDSKNLKEEVVEFLEKNNVDTSKLIFKYSEKSRFEKSRYKNPEQELWIYKVDGGYVDKKGKRQADGFVLTESSFNEYKEAGKVGIDLLIYGNELPLISPKQMAKGGEVDSDVSKELEDKIFKASLTFPTREEAELFALKWGRYSRSGHIVGSGLKDVEVTIFNITEKDKEWVNSYIENVNNDKIKQEQSTKTEDLTKVIRGLKVLLKTSPTKEKQELEKVIRGLSLINK